MAINVDRSFSAYLVLVILSLAPLHAKPASALSGEAGEDNAIAVCSNATPFLMIDSLLGTPQPGGAWITSEELPHGPLFIPGIHMGGTYCYVVGGDTACLSITVSVPPYAGSDGFLSICGDSLPELPFPNGADTTGHWVNCGPDVHCYVVTGAGTCPNDTAMVTVNLVTPPNAGGDNAITVCSDTPPFLMTDSLLGEPDQWGSWDHWGVPVNGVFFPSTGASGTYTYTVPGMLPCTTGFAHLSITVATAPSAGNDGFLFFCADTLPALPFPIGADTTGYWVNCGPDVHCYVVTGAGTCPNDTAMVMVDLVAPPNAGIDNAITVCSDAPPFLMTDSLLGEPDHWGSWDHWGVPVSGVFFPSASAPGAYTYTVHGTPPCVAALAHLTIMVLPSSDPQCLSTGVAGPSIPLTMQSMPNPSNGQFNLSYPVQPEAGTLEVLDMQGRVVYQSRLAAWSQVHRVVLEQRAAGIYQCRVSWAGRSISTRIIITEP